MQTSELTDALTCYILHYKSVKRRNIPHMTRLVALHGGTDKKNPESSNVLPRSEILLFILRLRERQHSPRLKLLQALSFQRNLARPLFQQRCYARLAEQTVRVA